MGAAAKLHQLAAGQHGLHTKHIVAGNAVFDGAQAPGAGNDIAANAGGLAAGGIRRIKHAQLFAFGLKLGGIDARLHHGHKILLADLHDFIHAQHGNHNARNRRHTPARKACAAPARVHGHALLVGPAHKFAQLPGVFGAHHGQHRAREQAGIRGVHAQHLGVERNAVLEQILKKLLMLRGERSQIFPCHGFLQC